MASPSIYIAILATMFCKNNKQSKVYRFLIFSENFIKNKKMALVSYQFKRKTKCKTENNFFFIAMQFFQIIFLMKERRLNYFTYYAWSNVKCSDSDID